MLGTAIWGMLLQFLFDRGTSLEDSYRIAFGMTIVVALMVIAVISTLKEKSRT